MARPKKAVGMSSAELLEFLPTARRQQILNEAVGSKVQELFKKYHQSTLGALVHALTADPHWTILQNVSLSIVLQPAGKHSANSNGHGHNTSHASHGAPAANHSSHKAGPGRPRGRRSKLNDSLLDDILAAVEKSPGMRSEQIQRLLPNLDAKMVKQGLHKLRLAKRVKTLGARRATTYAASSK